MTAKIGILPMIQLAYNSSFHETIRFSPFYMLFARDPVLPMDVAFKVPIANLQLPTSEYILGLKENFLATWKAADIEILRSQQCAKARQKVHDPQFAEGDLFLLENERKTRAISAKLQAKYLVPYRIVRLDGSLNADLIDLTDPAEPPCRVHTRRLIRYFGLYVPKLSERPQPPLLSGSSVDHSTVLEIDEPELEPVAVVSNVNVNVNVSNFRDLFCDGVISEPHNKFESFISLPIEVLKNMSGRGLPPPGAGAGPSGNIPFSQVLVRNEYGFDQARNNGERNLVIATNSSITGTGQTAHSFSTNGIVHSLRSFHEVDRVMRCFVQGRNPTAILGYIPAPLVSLFGTSIYFPESLYKARRKQPYIPPSLQIPKVVRFCVSLPLL